MCTSDLKHCLLYNKHSINPYHEQIMKDQEIWSSNTDLISTFNKKIHYFECSMQDTHLLNNLASITQHEKEKRWLLLFINNKIINCRHDIFLFSYSIYFNGARWKSIYTVCWISGFRDRPLWIAIDPSGSGPLHISKKRDK